MQACGIESANQRINESANQQISESALDSGWQTAEFDIEWGKGIKIERDIPNVALAAGLITGAGGYLRYDDERIGHGRESTRAYLAGHPELMAEIRATVLGEGEGEPLSANVRGEQ